MATKQRVGRQGRAGTPGARGPRGARGTTGATGPRGSIGKAGPKGLQGLRGALNERDVLESVVTHFEDVYRQLTALHKRIDELQHKRPVTGVDEE
jgi:collagen triple helix repeat protein